jgi:hypothetical protein
MTTLAPILLSVMMLAAGGLIWGGAVAIRRGPTPLNGWLMIVAALVLIGNVLILTV